MTKDTNNFGKPVRLKNIEEFKRFLDVSVSLVNLARLGPTISNPKLASIIRSTKSAIFPMSIIELRSLLHSIIVSLLFFPATSVMGPLISESVCFVYLRTRDLIRVDFPT